MEIDNGSIQNYGVQSAGGCLSLLLELDNPDRIRALKAVYPSVYIRNSYFMEVVENMLLRVLMLPASIVTEHVAGVKVKEMAVGRWWSKDGARSADVPFDSAGLFFQGVYGYGE
jgi:hypothetical protein